MSGLSFSYIYFAFLLLLLIPMWVFYRQRFKSGGVIHTYLVQFLRPIVLNKRSSSHFKNMWFIALLFSLLVLSAMRPQYVYKPIAIKREGRNIMLALDISESMEARDMKINGKLIDRFRAAQGVLLDFIDARPSDKLGLLVFGSRPFLHAPLSYDHKTIKQFLKETRIGFAGPKTAFGDAIGQSVKKLLSYDEGDRILVILTDGQNNTGVLTPMKAREIAANNNVKIYIVGLGASSMRVEGFFGETMLNPSKDLEEAEPTLKKIAKSTGGYYFRAHDPKGLLKAYQKINALEPSKGDDQFIIPKKELFYWPLSLVLILLVLRALLFLYEERNRGGDHV